MHISDQRVQIRLLTFEYYGSKHCEIVFLLQQQLWCVQGIGSICLPDAHFMCRFVVGRYNMAAKFIQILLWKILMKAS